MVRVESTGETKFAMTSHGRAYIASEKELREQIETNLSVVEEQQAALALLNA